jgi:hypothetical protein
MPGAAWSTFFTQAMALRSSVKRPLKKGDSPVDKISRPISTEYIHSVYSGKRVTSVVDERQDFHSTNQFDRDPAHSGQAPQDPKSFRKPYGR